jgi:hypothetical protein
MLGAAQSGTGVSERPLKLVVRLQPQRPSHLKHGVLVGTSLRPSRRGEDRSQPEALTEPPRLLSSGGVSPMTRGLNA